MRDVSARSRCHILTPPVLQGAGTVVWTLPIRRAVFSAPEGRTLEDTATPHRTDLMVTNPLTCPKDTVSHSFVITQTSPGRFRCFSSSPFISEGVQKLPLSCSPPNRAENDGAGPGVLPPHADRCQHLARPPDTPVCSHAPSVQSRRTETQTPT